LKVGSKKWKKTHTLPDIAAEPLPDKLVQPESDKEEPFAGDLSWD